MLKESGGEWEYKDRRQEIVFIGHGMKRDAIKSMRLNWGQYSGIRAQGVPVKNGFKCSHLLPDFGPLFRLII